MSVDLGKLMRPQWSKPPSLGVFVKPLIPFVMKDSYSIIDLFIGATDLISFDDFYTIGFRASATQFQGKYTPQRFLAISEVAGRLSADGHEITDWHQEVDKHNGYVNIDFRINGKAVEFTLT